MITGINEAKILVENISCDCKCKLDSIACNSNQRWNNDTCQYEFKNYQTCKKDYTWNLSICNCQNC